MTLHELFKKELEQFKSDLIGALTDVVKQQAPQEEKPWIRLNEVCEILSVSKSTVSNMRVRGQLKAKKIGGINYYSIEEIRQLMSQDRF